MILKILVISLIFIAATITQQSYAASEDECILYPDKVVSSTHIIKIQPPFGEPNGCLWLIDKNLDQGWALYSYMPINDYDICKCDMVIMVR